MMVEALEKACQTRAGENSSSYTESTSESVVATLTFTGRRSDPESGLMYYRHRYYSAELGRFVTRDPVRQPNLYVYVENKPTYFLDPKGMKLVPCTEVSRLPAPEGWGSWPLDVSIITPWGSTPGPISMATAQALCTWERRVFVTWNCPPCCKPTGRVETNSRVRKTQNSGAATFEIMEVSVGFSPPWWPPQLPSPSVVLVGGVAPTSARDFLVAIKASRPAANDVSGTVLRPFECLMD